MLILIVINTDDNVKLWTIKLAAFSEVNKTLIFITVIGMYELNQIIFVRLFAVIYLN